MPAVSNSSPLIFLAAIGQFQLLHEIYGEILVPPAVWRETVAQPLPGSDRVGFGTTVLKTMVRQSLGAEVERLCHDDGIEWRFAVPLSAIDPDRAPLGADHAPSE